MPMRTWFSRTLFVTLIVIGKSLQMVKQWLGRQCCLCLEFEIQRPVSVLELVLIFFILRDLWWYTMSYINVLISLLFLTSVSIFWCNLYVICMIQIARRRHLQIFVSLHSCECLLPSLAFALPRVLTFSSNNTEILLRVCISVNVLHIKDISEKILYIKEQSHHEDSWLKGSGTVLDEECSLNNT